MPQLVSPGAVDDRTAAAQLARAAQLERAADDQDEGPARDEKALKRLLPTGSAGIPDRSSLAPPELSRS